MSCADLILTSTSLSALDFKRSWLLDAPFVPGDPMIACHSVTHLQETHPVLEVPPVFR
jgi:hypothetical protein